MEDAALRANLRVSGQVEVGSGTDTTVVAIVRATDWAGRPYLGHFTVMLVLSRLWRWLRRDRRWLVITIPGAKPRSRVVHAEAVSRDLALDRAVALAKELTARS